jgi:hypothetical protein
VSLANDVGLTGDLDVGHAAASAFLNPVLAGEVEGRWDPYLERWGLMGGEIDSA